MKANELMIKDWVAFQGHPYQMTANDIASIADCEARGVPTDLSEIPLTPEILEKNGFERTSDGWECNESDVLTIAIHDGDSCDIWIAEAPFDCKHLTYVLPFTRSVHELQHALRLCNIEKTIEL